MKTKQVIIICSVILAVVLGYRFSLEIKQQDSQDTRGECTVQPDYESIPQKFEVVDPKDTPYTKEELEEIFR
jgi:hypothetical protein